MLERQFSNLVAEASLKEGDTSKILTSYLESRLDNAVFRAGFAKSRLSARQLVSHGLITVNGRRVDVPSFRAKPGMIIAVKENKKKKRIMENLSERIAKAELPSWVSVNPEALSAKILNEPVLENPNFNAQSIIEYYSR